MVIEVPKNPDVPQHLPSKYPMPLCSSSRPSGDCLASCELHIELLSVAPFPLWLVVRTLPEVLDPDLQHQEAMLHEPRLDEAVQEESVIGVVLNRFAVEPPLGPSQHCR